MSLAVTMLIVTEWRELIFSGEYLLMTTNAEEETNPPEIAEMLWLDGSVGRALEYHSKGRGWVQIPPQSKFSDFDYSPLPGVTSELFSSVISMEVQIGYGNLVGNNVNQ